MAFTLTVLCKLKPTPQTVHLFFADTKANAEKTKRAFISPPPPRNKNHYYLMQKQKIIFTFANNESNHNLIKL
ncbi:MAG: Uncharacterised protein [Bacteroidota bacterium]|nr:MAG: Uncharacterised protein [Bacteroidota bacterium]